MNTLDPAYQQLLKYVIGRGSQKTDRTGTGTLSVFGRRITHDLGGGFPLLTTKKMAWNAIKSELSWFLSGSTDIRDLWENNNHIWDGDYEKSGRDDYKLGPIYGHQWRCWDGPSGWIDQIRDLIEGLKNNPDSRRHLVSAWNVGELDKMVLPPCHYAFQCYVRGDYLDLMWQQRSGDLFLGVPFNIASYALLLTLLAKEVDLIPGCIIGNFGDLHLYTNHIKQAREQISRSPLELPTLKVNDWHIMSGEFDVELIDYQSHPQIKAPLSN